MPAVTAEFLAEMTEQMPDNAPGMLNQLNHLLYAVDIIAFASFEALDQGAFQSRGRRLGAS